MPIGEKARRAAILCGQLHRGEDQNRAISELGQLYPHTFFHLQTTPFILSVIYMGRWKMLNGIEGPSLPKALQFHAHWMAQLDVTVDGPVLYWDKSKLFPIDDEQANIRQFQGVMGLPQDGIVGPATAREMRNLAHRLRNRVVHTAVVDRAGPRPANYGPRTRWDRILGDDL